MKKEIPQNVASVIATCKMEGFDISNESLEYARKRENGSITCKEYVDNLIKKYRVTTND
ncbi:MAG: hypothetical protein RR348_01340 [Clostridia bacterium]